MSAENVKKIATRLGVSETEVVSMNRRLSAGDQSLNAPVREDGDGEWIDWLVEDAPDQETRLGDEEELENRSALLATAMGVLNDRERRILTERRLRENPSTLEALSGEYDISRERVRQIEVRAFEKLQKAMRNAALLQQRETANRVPAAD